MPPRSPTARPAARASSSRGRIPAEKTIRSVSRLVPSTKISLWRRVSPSTISFVFFFQVDLGAQRLDLAPQEPAGGIVELHRHQRSEERRVGKECRSRWS